MTAATDRVSRITTASPEQRLCAAMLVDAQEACRRGCGESCEWLERVGLSYLLVVAGDREDLDQFAQRLKPGTVQLRLEAIGWP